MLGQEHSGMPLKESHSCSTRFVKFPTDEETGHVHVHAPSSPCACVQSHVHNSECVHVCTCVHMQFEKFLTEEEADHIRELAEPRIHRSGRGRATTTGFLRFILFLFLLGFLFTAQVGTEQPPQAF